APCTARPSLAAMFFFSSRRRHTRFSRDWSSDVCSSDLVLSVVTTFALGMFLAMVFNDPRLRGRRVYRTLMILPYAMPGFLAALQIGRASCRERGATPLGAGAPENKTGDKRRTHPTTPPT